MGLNLANERDGHYWMGEFKHHSNCLAPYRYVIAINCLVPTTLKMARNSGKKRSASGRGKHGKVQNKKRNAANDDATVQPTESTPGQNLTM